MKTKDWIKVVFCLFISLIVVTICSRSSFLYPMNNWDDSNCYFTIGKSMVHGKVLYKDVFDHKGPYLYFLYGLCYLISHTSFLGVYFLEILSFSISCYFAFQIIELFSKECVSYILTPIWGACVMASVSLYWGGSAEEIFLPFLLITFYIFLKNWKVIGETVSNKEMLMIGICAGIWALVKYTLLFYFAGIMIVLILRKLCEKNVKQALQYSLYFLIGFILTFIPWILYFAVHSAIKDWFESYILINIQYAGGGEKIGLVDKIKNWIMTLYWDILDNKFYFVWIILGMLVSLKVKQRHFFERFGLWFIFALSFLGIYLSGTTLKYYAYPLALFSPLGLAFLAEGLVFSVKKEMVSQIIVVLSGLSIAVSTLFCVFTSGNVSFMKEKDYYLFSFRDLINESEAPSLLNYGCLDAGLFMLCDIQPEMKWFHQVNAGIDEMYDGQRLAVQEGITEYVYARDSEPRNIYDHYELISRVTSDAAGMEYTYYLYRRVK